MSEFAPKLEQHEALPSPERQEHLALPTAEQAEPLRRGEQDPAKNIAEARNTIAETAEADTRKALDESLKAAEAASKTTTPLLINSELKDVTLRRELKSLQRHESPVRRSLSKVIHQPAVRVTSEVVGASLSRPSGILGGGVMAFIGTSAYLLLAKHYGFTYNSTVFLALFAGGFALGLILELIIHFTFRRRATD